MSLATPDKIRRFQRKLYTKAKREPSFRFYQLYDKIYREDILQHAWRLCRANGGSPGVDGMTFEKIDAQGRKEWLEELRRSLHSKTYEPDPVRRVLIPKPGGGERPLGIPTIRDRVVQAAAKLVLEPIFEADFEDSAYGYRPRRSAKDAVQEVHCGLCEGYTDVVDADLTGYFDSIPHGELLEEVKKRVSDIHVLELIRKWLRTPVEERDARGRRRLTGGRRHKRGTPQGGVISPLLANIYMNRFLRAWRYANCGEDLQARIVSYADDFVILTRRQADRACEWARKTLDLMGLTLNERKTRTCNAWDASFDFLGYTFGSMVYRKTGRRYLGAQPSKTSVARIRRRICGVLYSAVVGPWPSVRDRLNRILDGWATYFDLGTRTFAYRAVDNFVQNAVRNFLQRRHKVPGRGTRRFSDAVIFDERGVRRLRTKQLGPRAHASV